MSDAPSRPERRARLQRTSARPTSSKGMSARSGRTSCGSPTFPRKREVPPSYVRVFSGWVYVAFVTDVYSRRIIGWQTTYRPARTDLALDALEMAVWQRKRQGADLSGLVHHLRPRRAVQVHPLRAGPVRVRGGRLGGFQRGTPFGFALAEALNSLYKAELIRNQGPWQDIDAARGRHRRVGALVRAPSDHTPPSACAPRRAQSRLDPRRQPEQPETITTGNHRHQINQPPQNPGLDKDSLWGLAEAGLSPVSYATVKRHLPNYATEDFTRDLSRLLAGYARIGRASLVLLDVTTLYYRDRQGRQPCASRASPRKDAWSRRSR